MALKMHGPKNAVLLSMVVRSLIPAMGRQVELCISETSLVCSESEFLDSQSYIIESTSK